MALCIENIISESMKAKAEADINKPVARAVANEHNAAAFKDFCSAVGYKPKPTDTFGDMVNNYVTFCRASGD